MMTDRRSNEGLNPLRRVQLFWSNNFLTLYLCLPKYPKYYFFIPMLYFTKDIDT